MNVAAWDFTSAAPAWAQGAVMSIGNFDGVHLGHAALLKGLESLKRRLHRPSVAATFDPPPIRLLQPDSPVELLTTLPERLALMEKHGVDSVLIFRTTPELLGLSAEQFWKELLLGRLDVQGLVEGPNFHFGHDREGNVQLLEVWCHQEQIPLEVVREVYARGIRISSSQIRTFLRSGDVEIARHALAIPGALPSAFPPPTSNGSRR
jgi:riboflavin kinase/FMN adenylyltransferase